MAPLAANMSKVDVYASSVLDSSLTESWQHARSFGQASWWSSAGHGEFAVKRLGSKAVTEIGCERMFSIGNARLFEELTALDDMEHIVRWVLVSHPSTISPFGQASFLNYTSSIQLRAVTMTNQTFAEWRGQFWTEPHHAAQMEAMLQSWYFAGFKALEAYASGLEALEVPISHHIPNVLNPNFSVPVEPPPNEQVAFQSPLDMRYPEPPVSTGPPSISQGLQSVSQPPSGGSRSSNDRYGNGAGMATTSSHAWQAARAAFSGPSTGIPSTALPSRTSLPKSSGPPTSQVRVPQGPSSNGSSTDSQRMSNGRRTTDYEPTRPHNTHDSPPIGTTNMAGLSGVNYHSHLGSIQEGRQMPSAEAATMAQGPGGRAELLDRSISNLSTGQYSKSNSLSSDQSTGSAKEIFRHQLGLQGNIPVHSSVPNQSQLAGQAVQSRKSWQKDELPRPNTRPQSASAMKDEAMQKLNLGSGSRPSDQRSNMRRNIRPDWDSMKETAYLDSEQDAELMAGVAKNMGTHHQQNTQRTSLEEEVAKLQERHRAIHGARKSSPDKQYVSPFSANPFAAAQTPFS